MRATNSLLEKLGDRSGGHVAVVEARLSKVVVPGELAQLRLRVVHRLVGAVWWLQDVVAGRAEGHHLRL